MKIDAKFKCYLNCFNLLVFFQVFDQNGDGKISAEELKQVMNNLGEVLTEDEIDQVYTLHQLKINFRHLNNWLICEF